MKTRIFSALTLISFHATSAMAHVGPEAPDHHLAEHLLIALAIGLPLVYGLLRLLKRSGDPR